MGAPYFILFSTKPPLCSAVHLSRIPLRFAQSFLIMKSISRAVFGALFCLSPLASAEVKIVSEHLDNEQAKPEFKLPTVPAARRSDAGGQAKFKLIDGERDGNGGDVRRLQDGMLPKEADQPSANFFLRGGDGGRLLLDLGKEIEVKQVNTYSWHGGERGPQVYRLYASDGKAAGFAAEPKRPADPAEAGWKIITNVDTRGKGAPGGQYGVSISDSTGSLGKYRYLLLDIAKADNGPFGQTFYSEIDVIDRAAPETPEEPVVQILKSVDIEGGWRFTVETTDAPDLTEWAHQELIPVVQKWYPILVKMLPSDGYTPPRTFSINFTNDYKGVAATIGNRVVCDPSWYRGNYKREGLGSVVHELVHVIQQYGRARKPGATRAPGWLVEGLCDYIRWYLYEPESKGAEIRSRNAANAKYDGSYRVTGNFLNFVVNKYDKDLIKELNAAMREGRYTPEIWKTRTGKPVEELAEEWKKVLEGVATPAPAK